MNTEIGSEDLCNPNGELKARRSAQTPRKIRPQQLKNAAEAESHFRAPPVCRVNGSPFFGPRSGDSSMHNELDKVFVEEGDSERKKRERAEVVFSGEGNEPRTGILFHVEAAHDAKRPKAGQARLKIEHL